MDSKMSISLARLAVAVVALACTKVGSSADLVRITEFMAANDRSLPDEDGDYPDWIELNNAGTNPVNLDGWYLTDRPSDLRQWRLPATNLLANEYLIVFASENNRRVPGAPLHTSFRLSNNGEYLALVEPDGVTVASAYSPVYPPQVPGVSYGLGLQETTTTLLAAGASSRFMVPQNGALGNTWTLPAFNDGSWANLATGVGYDVDGTIPFVPTVIADSVSDFSGTQGQGNWFYGYWSRKTDGNGTYAADEFVPFPNNYWTGTAWDWSNGDPPYTQLNSQGGQPSGDEGSPIQPVHWAIRRYV